MTHFPISTPLNLGDLLDRVFRLYRVHIANFLLAVALFVVPLGILSALLLQNSTANAFLMMRSILEPDQSPLVMQQPNPWVTFFMPVLALLVQGFVSLVSTQLAIDALHRRELEVRKALQNALRKFFPWLGMMILVLLVMVAIGIGVTILFMILGVIFSIVLALIVGIISPVFASDPGFMAGAGLVLLGVLFYIGIIVLFASPFVYFYARWSVAMPALLDGDFGPTEALRRSWNLTKLNSRRAVAFVVLIYVLVLVVIGAPSSALQMIAGFALPTDNHWIVIGFFSAINVLASLLTSPISAIAYVLFYYELRVRKESYDLEVALE